MDINTYFEYCSLDIFCTKVGDITYYPFFKLNKMMILMVTLNTCIYLYFCCFHRPKGLECY